MHWRSSGRRLGVPADLSAPGVAVVLGFANRGHRINAVNRARVRTAMRLLQRAPRTRLVLSGGAVSGPVPEAELLARHLRERYGWRGPLQVESTSRTTAENIRNVIPVLEGAERIHIVSDAMHAERARAVLHALRPDLASRLASAGEYRFGQQILLKPLVAVRELRIMRHWANGEPTRIRAALEEEPDRQPGSSTRRGHWAGRSSKK